MAITRKQIEERLAQYKQAEQVLQNDLNATRGAIQDCDHWLKVLDEEEAQSEATVQ